MPPPSTIRLAGTSWADVASRVVQVYVPGPPPSGADTDLAAYAEGAAGPGTRARVISGEDPAALIVEAAEAEGADVLVVGNIGMSGRKEFLLGNVPNRVSHSARCTVVIVNTTEPPKRRRLWSRS